MAANVNITGQAGTVFNFYFSSSPAQKATKATQTDDVPLIQTAAVPTLITPSSGTNNPLYISNGIPQIITQLATPHNRDVLVGQTNTNTNALSYNDINSSNILNTNDSNTIDSQDWNIDEPWKPPLP